MRAAPRDASVSPSDRTHDRTGDRASGSTQEGARERLRDPALPAARKSSARGVPAGLVPALLRTRPVASGEHFSAHGKAVDPDAARADAPMRGLLVVAVPKRVLRRAVDRNAMRRVAREAWRGSGLDRTPIVALVRMKRAPALAGSRARKLAARSELDRLFETLRRRFAVRTEGRPSA